MLFENLFDLDPDDFNTEDIDPKLIENECFSCSGVGVVPPCCTGPRSSIECACGGSPMTCENCYGWGVEFNEVERVCDLCAKNGRISIAEVKGVGTDEHDLCSHCYIKTKII